MKNELGKKNTFKKKKKRPRRAAASRWGRGWCVRWMGSSRFFGLRDPPRNHPSACWGRYRQLGVRARVESAVVVQVRPTSPPGLLSPSFSRSAPPPVLPVRVLRCPGSEILWCRSWGEASGEMGHFVAGEPRLDSLKKLNLGTALIGTPKQRRKGTQCCPAVWPPWSVFVCNQIQGSVIAQPDWSQRVLPRVLRERPGVPGGHFAAGAKGRGHACDRVYAEAGGLS